MITELTWKEKKKNTLVLDHSFLFSSSCVAFLFPQRNRTKETESSERKKYMDMKNHKGYLNRNKNTRNRKDTNTGKLQEQE